MKLSCSRWSCRASCIVGKEFLSGWYIVYVFRFLFVSMMVVCVMYAHRHSSLSPPQSSLLHAWLVFVCILSHWLGLLITHSYHSSLLSILVSLRSVVCILLLLSCFQSPLPGACPIAPPRTALGSVHLLLHLLCCRLSLP